MLLKPVACSTSDTSLSPKLLEPARRKLGVPNGMLNVLVAEIGWQRPRVVTVIRQLIAASVAQHVRVRLETKPGLYARPLNHAGEACGGERRPALRREDEGRLRLLLALETAPRPVRAWSALLDPPDLKGSRLSVLGRSSDGTPTRVAGSPNRSLEQWCGPSRQLGQLSGWQDEGRHL